MATYYQNECGRQALQPVHDIDKAQVTTRL